MDPIATAYAAEVAVEAFSLRDAYLVAGAAIAVLLTFCGYLVVRVVDAQREIREAQQTVLLARIAAAEEAAADAIGRAERFHEESLNEARMLDARMGDFVHKDELRDMRAEVNEKLDKVGAQLDEGLKRLYDKLDTKADKG